MSPGNTIALVLAAIACVAGGCSSDDEGDGTDGGGASSSSGAGASTSTGAGSGGDGEATPEESCVQPGDHGNNLGVGEYCTPTGGECEGFDEAGLCLASVGQDQWFCTQIGCDETTDCGEDAGCLITGDGSACVPCRCSDHCSGTGGGGVGGAGGSGGGAGGK